MIQDDPETPENAVYMINQAIGQTNLLIRKKFSRFESLVGDCETGKGEMIVRCADLLGFWEMMQRDIRDCDSRFSKLEELRDNGWNDEEEQVEQSEVKIAKKKHPVVKKKVEGKSNMKAFIEAQRKKRMAAQNPAVEIQVTKPTPKVEKRQSLLSPGKTLPKPVSPHSRAKLTPRTERTSLLKQVCRINHKGHNM